MSKFLNTISVNSRTSASCAVRICRLAKGDVVFTRSRVLHVLYDVQGVCRSVRSYMHFSFRICRNSNLARFRTYPHRRLDGSWISTTIQVTILYFRTNTFEYPRRSTIHPRDIRGRALVWGSTCCINITLLEWGSPAKKGFV